MLAKYILVMFACLFLIAVPSMSQDNIRLEITAGYLSTDQSATVLANWREGWTLGGGVAYPVGSRTELLWDAKYSKLSFDGNHLYFAFPAVVGYRATFTGEPSNLYESAVGVRLSTPGSFLRLFLALHAGVLVLDVGNIAVSQWMSPRPDPISSGTYVGSGTIIVRSTGSVGFGAVFRVNSSLHIIAEARFVSVFGLDEMFLPLTVSVQTEF